MAKFTKDEQRKIAALANAEGWPLVKEIINSFVMIVEQEIMTAPAEDRDKMLALADKMKFGTGSLLWLVREIERYRDALDNEE